jgi:hypothetical protein
MSQKRNINLALKSNMIFIRFPYFRGIFSRCWGEKSFKEESFFARYRHRQSAKGEKQLYFRYRAQRRKGNVIKVSANLARYPPP